LGEARDYIQYTKTKQTAPLSPETTTYLNYFKVRLPGQEEDLEQANKVYVDLLGKQ